MSRYARALTTLVFGFAPSTVLAHGTLVDQTGSWWTYWGFDPWLLAPLLLGVWLYVRGVRALWRRAGFGRGVSRRSATSFATGIAVLTVALFSPLDGLAERSFWVHMTQHLLLLLVAPPLLVAGAADTALLWALPQAWRPRFGRLERALGRTLGHGAGGNRNRLVVVAITTGFLWLWHVPVLYDLAVAHEGWHAAEHATFLITALLFWASVLRLRSSDQRENGNRILAVVVMALQGSMLGALITFASRPLYRSYEDLSGPLGLDALADQQIAGLIMWVPPAFLYLAAATYLFVSWLEAAGKGQRSAGDGPGTLTSGGNAR